MELKSLQHPVLQRGQHELLSPPRSLFWYVVSSNPKIQLDEDDNAKQESEQDSSEQEAASESEDNVCDFNHLFQDDDDVKEVGKEDTPDAIWVDPISRVGKFDPGASQEERTPRFRVTLWEHKSLKKSKSGSTCSPTRSQLESAVINKQLPNDENSG
ncbi:hypothetical protein R1flu_006422 [Riccia fluitans]|uniref:Uncharacterized protein n=1 Tax=Riccia fluitans TaxID=41844 RepID=A0ABD1YWN6_9MARC